MGTQLPEHDLRLHFVGTVGGFERPLVEQSGITFDSYDEVQAGPLSGIPLPRRIISVFRLAWGTVQALRLLRAMQPNALLLTGGWVGFPVALAAWLLRIPALIYLPDIEPGLTIRVLRRFVRRVAITVPDSAAYFRKGQTVVTGYPLRRQMHEAAGPYGRKQALRHFDLDERRKTLLVFGGSRGARSINHALVAILPQLLEAGLQVIHVTGSLDWDEIRMKTGNYLSTPETPTHYHAFPYLHDKMGAALAAADLVVCRSGASVLGELPLFGLASILVPYPYAWRYQKVNADYLAQRGAAVRVNDEAMAESLLPTIHAILDDSLRLLQMQAAASALAQPDAAANIARELLQLAGHTPESARA